MLHPILGQVPIIFFFEAVGEPLQVATGKAPTDEQAESPVQPPAADHGADRAHVQRSANKALPRGDNGDQAQLHVPQACARKPAKPFPPRAEVFAIEKEVARGLARLTALSGMAEPQRRKLSCAYCRWDRQLRHTIECCLHKPGPRSRSHGPCCRLRQQAQRRLSQQHATESTCGWCLRSLVQWCLVLKARTTCCPTRVSM